MGVDATAPDGPSAPIACQPRTGQRHDRKVTDLRWAPPTRADDAEWAGLLAAIEAADGFGEAYGPEELDAEWASVWARPETDAVFLWDGPALVAFGWLRCQLGGADGHRIDLWGGVHPDRRREGIGAVLLRWQVDRARAIAGALDDPDGTSIRLIARADHDDRLALAARFGFRPLRRFHEVARPAAGPLPPAAPVPGLALRWWGDDLDGPTRAAHAEAFAAHWGEEPRTEAEWRQWYTGHRGFRPDLSAVAVDDGGTVAAFVLTAAYPRDWAVGAAPVEAWITSVGTRPAWRRRGAGRWLLTEVLGAIATSSTGFERAILGVDAENPTGAPALYEALGFRPVRTVLTLAVSG